MTTGTFPYGDPTIEVERAWMYAFAPGFAAEESVVDMQREIELARQGQLPYGKWLMFQPADNVAPVWNAVASAVAEGQLGGIAKVSTARQNRDLQSEFVVCVYSPWADEPAVRRHLSLLRTLGIAGRLSYKRDNETWVKSRGGNAWYWSPEGDQLLWTRYAKEWAPPRSPDR